MPGRPARQCSAPGCRVLTHDGTGRCDQHKVAAWGHAVASRHARGYGTQWDKLRLLILQRDGYRCMCSECQQSGRLALAHEVDHVVSKENWRARHGTLDGVDDPSNLAAINRDCHARKTVRDKAQGWMR